MQVISDFRQSSQTRVYEATIGRIDEILQDDATPKESYKADALSLVREALSGFFVKKDLKQHLKDYSEYILTYIVRIIDAFEVLPATKCGHEFGARAIVYVAYELCTHLSRLGDQKNHRILTDFIAKVSALTYNICLSFKISCDRITELTVRLKTHVRSWDPIRADGEPIYDIDLPAMIAQGYCPFVAKKRGVLTAEFAKAGALLPNENSGSLEWDFSVDEARWSVTYGSYSVLNDPTLDIDEEIQILHFCEQIVKLYEKGRRIIVQQWLGCFESNIELQERVISAFEAIIDSKLFTVRMQYLQQVQYGYRSNRHSRLQEGKRHAISDEIGGERLVSKKRFLNDRNDSPTKRKEDKDKKKKKKKKKNEEASQVQQKEPTPETDFERVLSKLSESDRQVILNRTVPSTHTDLLNDSILDRKVQEEVGDNDESDNDRLGYDVYVSSPDEDEYEYEDEEDEEDDQEEKKEEKEKIQEEKSQSKEIQKLKEIWANFNKNGFEQATAQELYSHLYGNDPNSKPTKDGVAVKLVAESNGISFARWFEAVENLTTKLKNMSQDENSSFLTNCDVPKAAKFQIATPGKILSFAKDPVYDTIWIQIEVGEKGQERIYKVKMGGKLHSAIINSHVGKITDLVMYTTLYKAKTGKSTFSAVTVQSVWGNR